MRKILKLTDEYIINYINEEEPNYKVLEIFTKRIKNRNKIYIKLICDKGHEYQVNWDKFKFGRRCPYCKGGGIFDVEYIKERFLDKKLIPLFNEYKNAHIKLPYICMYHKEKGVQYITYDNLKQGCKCYYCKIESISGENHWNWKGGIGNLSRYLRGSTYYWIKDILKKYKNKCILTGIKDKSNCVHHLYSFINIVQEALDIVCLDLRDSFTLYTNEELDILKRKCLELHHEYGLGIVIHPKLHSLFHSLYGNGNNTPEQFEEFKTRLKIGEFNYFLEENSLSLII